MYPIYGGIFLVSMATLVLEVSLARVFAIMQWSHFAFVVISIALLGFGASGTALTVLPGILRRSSPHLLGVSAAFLSLAIPSVFWAMNRIPFDHFRILLDRRQILYLGVSYLTLSIPFFISGLITALALSNYSDRVGGIYAANLAGSGLGCLVGILVAFRLTGPGVILFSAFLGMVGALCFSLASPKASLALALSASSLALLWLSVRPPSAFDIRPIPYKDLPMLLRFPNTRILATRWNAMSRVDVVESPHIHHAPGLSLRYQEMIPPQLGVTVDADSLTAITQFDGDLSKIRFVDYMTSAAAYSLFRSPNVVIVGGGGGMDVLAALYNRASKVTVVELNPIIVGIVGEDYRDFAGNIYGDERVRVAIDDGRSFLRRSRESYDIIQMSLLDSQAAAVSGAYSLNESYLYTVEAFIEYYARLSPRGVLSITRWTSLPPKDLVKLFALAFEALERLGVESPERHIAVVRSWGTFTFLMGRDAFSDEDIESIRAFCKERSFDTVYYFGVRPEDTNLYNRFPQPFDFEGLQGLLESPDRRRFYADYIVDVEPPTDDKPFFYRYFKWRNISNLYKTFGRRAEPFIFWGDIVLGAVFLQALLGSFLLILTPLFAVRRPRLRRHIAVWGVLPYFLALGVGYMFIEIALIQKFTLFLGHPMFTLAVILFSLLVFSGLGSLVSNRAGDGFLPWVIVSLCLLAVLYALFANRLFSPFLGLGIVGRITVAVFLLSPLSVAMGMPFPMGLRLLRRSAPDLIPFAWGANGCASVVSSIVSVFIAIYWGFRAVFFLACVAYMSGMAAVSFFGRPRSC
ncbi:MAG: SAM-dependent methyltransferase [bacterium]